MVSNDLLLVMTKINDIETKISILSDRITEIEEYIDERLVMNLNKLICKYDFELKELKNRM